MTRRLRSLLLVAALLTPWRLGADEPKLPRLPPREPPEAAATIRAKSPTSLRIALTQMQRGGGWSFRDCLRAEYRIVSRIVQGHDFYEGVRALIIDKDNTPHWRPARLDEVSAAEIERYFAPLADELPL